MDDALCTVEIAIGHCLESNKLLWIMSIDISQAFDAVEHEAILYALTQKGVDPAYVALIATLYQAQLASVNERREFLFG